MRVPKTKEAARAQEKQKHVTAQTEIDRTDPEYVPLSDEEADAPEPSTSSSRAKKPEEARILVLNHARC